MPKAAESWSLTSLREKLIKIGAKVVSHGRYVTFPNGRGRGVTANVRGYPVAHHPAAGGARSSIKGALGSKGADLRWQRCVLMKANGQVPAPKGKATHCFACQAAIADKPCCQ